MRALIKNTTSLTLTSIPTIPAAQLGTQTSNKTSGRHNNNNNSPCLDAIFTCDGKYCLTAHADRNVRLFNPYRLDPAQAQVNRAKRRAIISNAENMATTMEDDYDDLSVNQLPFALPIQSYCDGYMYEVASIAVDPLSSQTLIAASGKGVFVTDVMTKQVIRRYHGHTGRVNTVACNDEASVVVSGSYDSTVRLWDVRAKNSHEPIQILEDANDSVMTVIVDSNNSRTSIISAGVDGKIREYDLRSGQIFCDVLPNALTSISLTKDRKCIAANCIDGNLYLIDRKDGKILKKYSGSHKAGQLGIQCDVTADDKAIVTGSEDGKAVFYDIMSNAKVQELLPDTAAEGNMHAICTVTTNPKPGKESVTITASDKSTIIWANQVELSRWEC